jgi:beta-glucosidase
MMKLFHTSNQECRVRPRFVRVSLIAMVVLAAAVALCASGPLPVYRDAGSPVDARVADLVHRMTVEEKIGQTLQAARDYLRASSDIATYGLGSVLSGGGSGPAVNDPKRWADMVDGYQKIALSSRLGIPILYGADAVHGHNNVKGAVIFPHNIGLGAADDPALVEEIGRVTALEMRATGVQWNFAPCIAVPRDERWGRTYEGFGEKPELVGALGAAYIRGLQSGGIGSRTAALATAKHFAGDGGTEGGKDRGNAVYSEEEFMAVHVAPYAKAIEAGARCVMVSFSSWNGEQCHGSVKLLTQILRGKLGFDGFVVSDWGGVALLPGKLEERIAAAFNAGVDMIMVPDEYARYFEIMRGLVKNGAITEGRLDEAVQRILRIKFEMGLFERPYADRDLLVEVGSSAHRALARRAVAESLVVLKNEGKTLPISGKKQILVAGPKARDLGAQCGGWTLTWQGRSGLQIPGTTIFDAVKAAAGAETRVEYSPDGSTPKGFSPELVIVVIGEEPYAEWYGDDADLDLPPADKKLVAAVDRLGAPVIAVLISGRPLIVTEQIAAVDSFVAAWLPGSEGGGVADVLFGTAKARGVLPCSWPASTAQIPVNAGDGRPCLFPAGFGLHP